MDKIGDWAFEHLGAIVAVLSVVLIGGCTWMLIVSSRADEEERLRFMAQCMRERKEYECTALWRQGETKTRTTVMPMPVYVGR